MKKWIYIILFAIISLVSYTLFYSAKTHVEAVQVVDDLVVKTDSLTTTVKVLHKEKDSALTKIELLDSTLTEKETLINTQNITLKILKRDTAALKKIGPIIIRDTIYITESKNFWGKKKTTTETSTSVDTLEITEPEPLKTDTIE